MMLKDSIDFMIRIAQDPKHGYSQKNRNGNPDYDCSSLVIAALKHGGFNTYGASYTGNMLTNLKKGGAKDVTSSVDLKTGKGLVPGDILLSPGKHVEMYTSAGALTGAHSDEKGGVTGAKVGDQTGNEISTRSYYNYPWKYVLRFEEHKQEASAPSSKTVLNRKAIECVIGVYGNGEKRKKLLGADYEAVQKIVNTYTKVAKDIMRGKYGNGEKRKDALTNAGYDPAVAQTFVNIFYKWGI